MSIFDMHEFTRPGRTWRPTVFWAWNGALSTEVLDAQIEYMKHQGLGGFFMHSRSGLETEYMSDSWMDAIRHTQQRAREADMNSWLYDEDRWPSGFAGGVVPAGGDKYRMKCLEALGIETAEVAEHLSDERTLAVFEVRQARGDSAEVVRRVRTAPSAALGDGSVLVAFRSVIGERSNWRNGETYVDLLDPDTTDRFLDATYEKYDQAIQLDEHTPGIFTDEPTVTLFSAEKGLRLPWTPALVAAFEQRSGEDLIAQLPSLYFPVGEWRKVRFFFWKTVCGLFAESFGRRCYDRADRLGIAFTGHYLFEENFVHQTVSNGAVMPLYEFQHIPGVDQLGPEPGEAITYKQVSSVARQLGRNRVVSETLGASGQGLSLQAQKAIFDRQLALGVNMFTKHIGLYTMTGERKRDYPPNVHYQQPYSGLTRQLHDYIARCAYAVSAGTAGGGVLLLHPISTAWALIGGGLTPRDHAVAGSEVDYETALSLYTKSDESRNLEVERYEAQFKEILDWLIGQHFEFDLGDESILAEHASIADGTLQVGDQVYGTVLVPPTFNIETRTLQLLNEFRSAGGTVITLGEAPSFVDGRPQDTGLAAADDVSSARRHLCESVERPVRVLDESGNEATDVIVHRRRLDGHQVFFFVNTSKTRRLSATVSLSGVQSVEELMPMNGEVGSVALREAENDRVEFEAVLSPGASKLYLGENK